MIKTVKNIFRRKPTIFAFVGYRGCGKNFVAEKLEEVLKEENISVSTFAFADPIKKIVSDLFVFTPEMIEKNKAKEFSHLKFPVGSRKLNMRNILIKTGELIKKYTFENIFVEKTIDNILKDKSQIKIITDLRFDIELKELKKNTNLKIIKVSPMVDDNYFGSCKNCDFLNDDEKDFIQNISEKEIYFEFFNNCENNIIFEDRLKELKDKIKEAKWTINNQM